MKYIRFKCAVILLSAFILAVNGVWKLGLTVSASSRVSIYSLWDYTGVHCNKTNVLYRHSFLDNLTSIAHCIKAINVLLVVLDSDDSVFNMKLTPISGDLSLESLLLKTPSVAEFWKTNVDISIDPNHHHLINTHNFEFIWLNAAKTAMYAGMYYNPVDPNSPKFSFSMNGVNYTAGGNSSHVLSDGDVKYLQMKFTIHDTCTDIIDDNTPQNCPGPDVSIQVNETDIPAGSQAAIACTMVSPLGILSVNWTLNDTDIDLSKAKYDGIVHGTHTLKINDFQSDDSGRYRCIAATAMGTGQSQERQIQMIVQPMCPCDCAYKKRLDYWASQVVPNHTMAEWREILAPVLDEIKKNLTVNKANLSATIRRLSSAPDERQSSKSVGFIGIALISFVCASFILIDITSIRRHLAVIREIIGHSRAIE